MLTVRGTLGVSDSEEESKGLAVSLGITVKVSFRKPRWHPLRVALLWTPANGQHVLC